MNCWVKAGIKKVKSETCVGAEQCSTHHASRIIRDASRIQGGFKMFFRQTKIIILFLLLFLFPQGAYSQEEESLQEVYGTPPKEIVDIVDAPLTPFVRTSPDGEWMLFIERPPLQRIKVLAQPELRLAGLRFNPENYGQNRDIHYNKMLLKKISDGSEKKITGLPEDLHFLYATWSPDSMHIAFSITREKSIELWVVDRENYQARPMADVKLNEIYDNPFYWVSDSKSIICRTVPAEQGSKPETSSVPTGPVIQETSGKKAPARTYQDLLKNPYDEELFEYYLKSQIIQVNLDGKVNTVGTEGLIKRCKPSPDGKYLLVEIIKRPFSYLVPEYRFPKNIEIWDLKGQIIKKIADLPLAEEIPISSDAVRCGPRGVDWREDVPSTVYWIEAQDGGDPGVKADVRDCIYILDAPFNSNPIPIISLTTRANEIMWCNENLALGWEYWNKTKMVQTWMIQPGTPENKPGKIFSYSKEDRYNNPGKPLLRQTKDGTSVIITNDRENIIYLTGDGGSPEGDRPFLDQFDLSTGKIKRLWQSEAPYYERIVRLLDEKNLILLTSRESQENPPNYFLRDLNKNEIKQITFFPHPTPELSKIQKQLLRYKRNDGVELTATLYLPTGYSLKDGPLPVVMWAYPREFKSADTAGQITISPYRFIRIYPSSPLIWLTQGYAVLDKPTMPIIGEDEEEPNDRYVEQLVASAEAAVEEVVRLGVADRNRIAIGGHSYGAFMVANLLAHTDLFRAGIACSGAYNRTLTPFGFQGEERTFWEAPQVYCEMSPFMHADKINEPILIIHGEADNNPGTYPMQSERFYDALKGLGDTARLVMLPCESHSYQARESVLHVLWEENEWLNKYVKAVKREKK